MSFSSKVKGELSLHFGNGRHCEIAEIAAYVNIYGQIAVFGGNFCLKMRWRGYGEIVRREELGIGGAARSGMKSLEISNE